MAFAPFANAMHRLLASRSVLLRFLQQDDMAFLRFNFLKVQYIKQVNPLVGCQKATLLLQQGRFFVPLGALCALL